MEEKQLLLSIEVFTDGTSQIKARVPDGELNMDPEIAKKACAMAFFSAVTHCLPGVFEDLEKRNQEIHSLYRGPAMNSWIEIAIRNALMLHFDPLMRSILQVYFATPSDKSKHSSRIIRTGHDGQDTGYRAN